MRNAFVFTKTRQAIQYEIIVKASFEEITQKYVSQ
jgi:hypothetical protein